jgi:hypothetical protein
MKKTIITLLYALIIWALCGATISVGRSLTNMETVLIIHSIGAPVFAFIMSLLYYKQFHDASPVKTASIFLLIIIIMDAGLVAPVFEKSYVMFTSFIGTWLPFILIFISVYLTGRFVGTKSSNVVKE